MELKMQLSEKGRLALTAGAYRWRLPLLLIILCFLINPSIMTAQQDTIVRFNSPLEHETDVPLLPHLIFESDWDIDFSSITHNYPNLDSNAMDSPNMPTIVLFYDAYFDSLSANQLKYFTVLCEYFILGPKTILAIPFHPLEPNTTYRAQIAGLNVIQPIGSGLNGDTVLSNKAEAIFTTTQIPHRIAYNPYKIQREIKCNDTLRIYFNRFIDTQYFELDSIMFVERIDSLIQINDSTFTYSTTQLQLDFWLDESQRILLAKPNISFTPGEEIRISVKTSYLNQDTLTDQNVIVGIKEKIDLSIRSVMASDSSEISENLTYPGTGMTSLYLGDTLMVTASLISDSLAFQRFEVYDKYGLREIVWSNVLTFVLNCDELDDLLILSYYEVIDSTEVIVNYMEGIKTSVYDSDLNFLGNYGSFFVAPGDIITITVDSSYYANPYDRIRVYPPVYRNTVSKIVVDPNNGAIRIVTIDLATGEEVGDEEDYPRYDYSVSVVLNEDIGCSLIDEYFDATYLAWGCNCASQQEVENNKKLARVSIKQQYLNKLKIYKMTSTTDGVTTTTLYDPPRSMWQQLMTPTNPRTDVVLWVNSEETYTLTVKTELKPYNMQSNNAEIGKHKDVTIRVSITGCNEQNRSDLRVYQYTTGQDLVIPNIPYSSHVKLEPLAMLNIMKGTDINQQTIPGFSFKNWDDSYDIPNGATPNSKSLSFIIEEDMTIKGIFEEHFRIEQIGIFRNNDMTPEMFKWKDLQHMLTGNHKDRKSVGNIDVNMYGYDGQYDIGYGAKFIIKFNSTPILPTIYYAGLKATTTTARIDEPLVDASRYPDVYFASPTNITQSSVDPTVIEFLLVNDNRSSLELDYRAITRGQEFMFEVSQTILDVNGRFLFHSGIPTYFQTFKQRYYTKLPGFIAHIDEVKALKESGLFDGDIELEMEIAGFVRNIYFPTDRRDLHTETIYKDVKFSYLGSPWTTFDYTIYTNHRMNWNDEVVLQLSMLDLDGFDSNIKLFEKFDFLWDNLIIYAGIIFDEECERETHPPDETPIDPVYREDCEMLYQIKMGQLGAFPYLQLANFLLKLAFDMTLGETADYVINGIINGVVEYLDAIFDFQAPDFLGSQLFIYNWDDHWFGAHPSVRTNGNFYRWQSNRGKHLDFKGDILLKKSFDWQNNETYPKTNY